MYVLSFATNAELSAYVNKLDNGDFAYSNESQAYYRFVTPPIIGPSVLPSASNGSWIPAFGGSSLSPARSFRNSGAVTIGAQGAAWTNVLDVNLGVPFFGAYLYSVALSFTSIIDQDVAARIVFQAVVPFQQHQPPPVYFQGLGEHARANERCLLSFVTAGPIGGGELANILGVQLYSAGQITIAGDTVENVALNCAPVNFAMVELIPPPVP
jgi:hypothetical protein